MPVSTSRVFVGYKVSVWTNIELKWAKKCLNGQTGPVWAKKCSCGQVVPVCNKTCLRGHIVNDRIKKIILFYLYLGNFCHDLCEKIKNKKIRKIAIALPFVVKSESASASNKNNYAGWPKWAECADT